MVCVVGIMHQNMSAASHTSPSPFCRTAKLARARRKTRYSEHAMAVEVMALVDRFLRRARSPTTASSVLPSIYLAKRSSVQLFTDTTTLNGNKNCTGTNSRVFLQELVTPGGENLYYDSVKHVYVDRNKLPFLWLYYATKAGQKMPAALQLCLATVRCHAK